MVLLVGVGPYDHYPISSIDTVVPQTFEELNKDLKFLVLLCVIVALGKGVVLSW